MSEQKNRLEKSVEVGKLLAVYAPMLTERQQLALRMHFDEDYSLSEIADTLQVSRQNVHDLIVRSSQKLKKYEEALQVVERMGQWRMQLDEAIELLTHTEVAKEEKGKHAINILTQISETIE